MDTELHTGFTELIGGDAEIGVAFTGKSSKVTGLRVFLTESQLVAKSIEKKHKNRFYISESF
ncbi:hypothetical protein NC661_07730 [Aquibacillus koreensis]|uniref:Uncharacterized protein n=1 Tax=Aquibacillus koreensis TaxID=279446 RepID=A0A9X3WIC0_9BACI|nr:hypothetical protein [Aquibacillus koreensis]MCT2535805.1 hypothetical protein [Aquibacillus koreensis]MDC3420260.1 hypothetical protein [Aquibacillus koreensis]